MSVKARRLHSNSPLAFRSLRRIFYGGGILLVLATPAFALQTANSSSADLDASSNLLLVGEKPADQWSGQWDWLSGEKLSLTTTFGGQYNLANLEKRNNFTGDLQFAPSDTLKFRFNFQQQTAYGNYLPASGLSGGESFFATGGKRDSQISAGWEWSANKRFSLTSNFLIKSHPEGSEQSDTLSGKLLLSPRANLKFNFNRQQSNGQGRQFQEICLENDWSRPQRPLKLIARSLHLSQEAGEGYRQEVNLNGGWQKAGMKFDFSGSMKQQQGYWEGLTAGHTFAFKSDAQWAKLKLSLVREAFTPGDTDTAAALTKSHFFANYSLAPGAELYSLQNTDNRATVTDRQRFGFKRTWGAMALEAAAENQESNSGDRNWRELKVVWKNKTPAPPWAQALAQQTLGQSARYGFSYWGSREPGLSLLYRQGGELGEAKSGMRLVYQRFVGPWQLGLGHEQNPCLSGEPMTLQAGARNFLEVGFPVNDQLTGRVWLAQQTLDGNRGQGWAVALGSRAAKPISWEGFFATAALSGGSGNSYGLRYSRAVNKDDYLNLKVCVNPALAALLISDWRMDIAISHPM
jgi:hypothetical protein